MRRYLRRLIRYNRRFGGRLGCGRNTVVRMLTAYTGVLLYEFGRFKRAELNARFLSPRLAELVLRLPINVAIDNPMLILRMLDRKCYDKPLNIYPYPDTYSICIVVTLGFRVIDDLAIDTTCE
jgi:hypothetical protein